MRTKVLYQIFYVTKKYVVQWQIVPPLFIIYLLLFVLANFFEIKRIEATKIMITYFLIFANKS